MLATNANRAFTCQTLRSFAGAKHVMRRYQIGAYAEDTWVKYPLAANENCYGSSEHATKAAMLACEDSASYPGIKCKELIHAIADQHSIDPDGIVLGPGSWSLIELIVNMLVDADRSAITAQYAFSGFHLLPENANMTLRTIAETGIQKNRDSGFWSAASDNDLILIDNPSNPSGFFRNADWVEREIRSAPDSAIIVIDEAYIEYATDNPLNTSLHLVKEFNNLIVLRTFSKVYGLAGFRIGWAYTGPNLADKLRTLQVPYAVSNVATAAALGALGDLQFVADCRLHNRNELAKLRSALEVRGIDHAGGDANFISADFSDQPEIVARFRENGFLFRDLSVYGLPGWLRLTVGTPKANHVLLEQIKQ